MSVDYLHTVMHCLYQHPFFCPRDSMKKDEAYWNLAADMAVECVLEEMEFRVMTWGVGAEYFGK